MRRTATDGDRKYAAWALLRGIELARSVADKSVLKRADSTVALVESGDLPAIEHAMRELLATLHFLCWNVPHDRELMSLCFNALTVGCGASSTDKGLIAPLVAMTKMNARLFMRNELLANRAARPSLLIARAADDAERMELVQISKMRLEFGALAGVGDDPK